MSPYRTANLSILFKRTKFQKWWRKVKVNVRILFAGGKLERKWTVIGGKGKCVRSLCKDHSKLIRSFFRWFNGPPCCDGTC